VVVAGHIKKTAWSSSVVSLVSIGIQVVLAGLS